MKQTLTVEQLARELRDEQAAMPSPEIAAFMDAIEARGTDGRTAQFKHYDRIIKWMIANWAEQLDNRSFGLK